MQELARSDRLCGCGEAVYEHQFVPNSQRWASTSEPIEDEETLQIRLTRINHKEVKKWNFKNVFFKRLKKLCIVVTQSLDFSSLTELKQLTELKIVENRDFGSDFDLYKISVESSESLLDKHKSPNLKSLTIGKAYFELEPASDASRSETGYLFGWQNQNDQMLRVSIRNIQIPAELRASDRFELNVLVNGFSDD